MLRRTRRRRAPRPSSRPAPWSASSATSRSATSTDRLLAYVHRDDGLFVNRQLALEGYADALTIEPNTAHRAEIAGGGGRGPRAAGRGLWGACGGPGVPAEPPGTGTVWPVTTLAERLGHPADAPW